MIWVTDVTGDVTYIRSDWEALTGQPTTAAQGQGWLDRVYPDDRATVQEIFRQAYAAKEQFVLKYRLLQKSGDFCRAVVSASPSILPETGEFLGFLGALKVIENAAGLSEASGQIGTLRPPSQILDNADRTAIEGLADQVIYARALAEEADERIVLGILDMALIEIGHRLARTSHDD